LVWVLSLVGVGLACYTFAALFCDLIPSHLKDVNEGLSVPKDIDWVS
jgi:hypothetical protein